METTMIVDGCVYVLQDYAYITVSDEEFVGYSSSPDLKFAGEIRQIPSDCEWLSNSTPIKRNPSQDTFLMECGTGEVFYTREQIKNG